MFQGTACGRKHGPLTDEIGIGSWALLRLREIARNSPPPFSATMNEFANDLKLLRGRDE